VRIFNDIRIVIQTSKEHVLCILLVQCRELVLSNWFENQQ